MVKLTTFPLPGSNDTLSPAAPPSFSQCTFPKARLQFSTSYTLSLVLFFLDSPSPFKLKSLSALAVPLFFNQSQDFTAGSLSLPVVPPPVLCPCQSSDPCHRICPVLLCPCHQVFPVLLCPCQPSPCHQLCPCPLSLSVQCTGPW